MTASEPNTIVVRGDDDSFQRESGEADGTISPGQIVKLSGQGSGAGAELRYQRNDTDNAVLVPRIALELSKTGKTINDDYADGDYFEFKVAESGDELQVLVFDGDNAGASGADTSDNANISQGDYLVPYSGSGEDGCFRAYDSGDGDTEGMKMFQALEAQDNSSGSSPAFVTAKKV